ncbi:SHPRH [Mytilus coruscus]|uniref:SHPRH n=1 Tax=Mytilus coruscus TaxID=42192 RepID=A0A6J8A6E8_MYTCO|nr:SHPRH [Mytilus coruscus]
MELELQTHCTVELKITPTWTNGKCHVYKSSNLVGEAVAETGIAAEPTAVVAAIAGPSGDAPEIPNSTGKRRVVPVTAVHPLLPIHATKTTKKANKKACRMCGGTTELSFWLGCGYQNIKTKRQDCAYWVHQKCIRLQFKKKDELIKLPFYCPKHCK